MHVGVQVTDTPGLLNRQEEERNAMERLTIACMAHLPTSIMFVMDLTGECGTSVATQWQIRADLRARFAAKPWLDVLTKQDMLRDVQAQAAATIASAPPSDSVSAQQELESACVSNDERLGSSRSSSSSGGQSRQDSLKQQSASSGNGHQILSRGADISEGSTEARQAASIAANSSGGGNGNEVENGEAGLGSSKVMSSKNGGRGFSWQARTKSDVQTALQAAVALQNAVWVSSLTEEGVDELQAAVLHMLQSTRQQSE